MTAVVAPEEPASPHPEGPRVSADPERPPSWTVAALLSLLLPGLGHIYARRTRRGVIWALSPIGLSLLAMASIRVRGPMFILPLFAVEVHAVVLRFAAAVDAACVIRNHPRPRLSLLGTTLAGLAILAFSEGYGLALKRFVIESFKIPSGSMIPAIFAGDHVFIDKLRRPARGDVIAFPFPEHPSQSFIKRIIGMPGETLFFRGGGHPVINGVEVPSCLVGRASYTDWDFNRTRHEGEVYLEVLGDRRYLTFYDDAVPRGDEGPFTVNDGEFFVIGDNRGNAHDSRRWYGGEGGGVPLSTVNGVAFVVWLAVTEQGVDWSREGQDLGALELPPSLGDLRQSLDACQATLKGIEL